MVNTGGKIGENRDKIDVGNHNLTSDLNTNLSSSSPRFSAPQNKGNESNNKKLFSETKIVYGTTAVMNVFDEVLSNCKDNYDVYCDKQGPVFMIAISPYKEEYAKLKLNNVKIRLITEITADNLKHCKEIIDKLGADVKHLEGVKGNFVISDKKIYLATATLEENKPIPDLVYSNSKGIIEQNQFLFKVLWGKAIPADQRIRELEEGLVIPETRIVRGVEDVFQIYRELFQDCKSYYDIYNDNKGPRLIIETPQHRKMYSDLKKRNVKIRLITDITSENIDYCERLTKEFDVELRHLPGIKGNFGLIDNKGYIANATANEKNPIPVLTYSNVREIVEQNRFIFETLWNKAIPAEIRIREIRDGLLTIETYMIDNPIDALTYVVDFVHRIEKRLSNCSSIGYFRLVYQSKPLFEAYLNLLAKFEKRKVKDGVRWITYIEDKNKDIDLIKKFLHLGIIIKHANHLPPLNFGVSDKQFMGTIEKIPDGKMFESLIQSTEPLYRSHFEAIFDELWNSSIDAEERIRQIEEGVSSESIRIIENSSQSKDIFFQLIEDSREEIMIIFPSLNSVKRHGEIGLFNLLKLKNQEKFRIRILCPNVDVLKEILLLEYSKEEDNKIANIAVREIVKQQSISSIVLMTDRKNLITIEVKDNTKEKFEDATGFTTYSTSTPTVYSYLSIFETLWAQTEISDSLRIANEKLVESEEMEREFINTAAHELRTPTQAIMGYTELNEEVFGVLLKNSNVASDNQLSRTITHLQNHFDVISRNAARLDDLIGKLLDVSRIESNLHNSLSLHKERLDLVREIKESIVTELNQKINERNIDIKFISDSIERQVWVNADKSRLHQIVINIVGNAIKFSNRNGKIDILIREKILTQGDKDVDNKNINVEISDNGKGISPHILPKLFEKFVTDSDIGTGLGLYISKNLVEAHGGKIWAFNNQDKPGSTFVFSLPKLESTILEENFTK